VPFITFTWVRQQLTEAWSREVELKKYVREYTLKHSDKLARHVEQLEKQSGRVRAEVEMWQMRNEEMETRLQT